MSRRFPEYKNLDLPGINKDILEKWKKENSFEKSIEIRKDSPAFIFFEGPPSANGMPGIHHVISRLIKDIFCRYKTQKGFRVDRKAGWDTHGLPIELAVEKSDIGKIIGKKGKTINAIRTLLMSVASRNGIRVNLEIIEEGK